MPFRDLTDVNTLEAMGIRADRKSGQNFLICGEVLEATVDSLDSDIKNVTELGAGLGTLTQALVGSGFNVRAIERDRNLIPHLEKSVPIKQRDQLEIIEGDLKQVDWFQPASKNVEGERWQLVGNIPYNLSGLILRNITQLDPAPERVVLLLQKEVSERVRAAPPNMSLLGLAMQLWGVPVKLLNVPATCFWPTPKVDSQLILIVPHESVGESIEERERVLQTAKIFFQKKRKQIGGVLRRELKMDDETVKQLMQEADIKDTMRPQELGINEWKKLADSSILKG